MATLPVRIDFATEQRLAQQLSSTRRMAAAALAQQVLEQLRDSLAGYLRIPHWQLPVTEEEQRPALEEAMAAGADIAILYWSTSSGATERRITPHFIEERHGVAYLHGYCHLRGQTRIFRIDRIAQLTIVAEETTD